MDDDGDGGGGARHRRSPLPLSENGFPNLDSGRSLNFLFHMSHVSNVWYDANNTDNL